MKELYQKNVYQKIGRILKEADAILIGASNGLSITEGLHLFAENDAFYQLFGGKEYCNERENRKNRKRQEIIVVASYSEINDIYSEKAFKGNGPP